MFNSPTVFIVGAGASSEAGLPTGDKLKDIIADKLNISFDPFEFNTYQPKSGDILIWKALQHHLANSDDKSGGLEPYRITGIQISRGLPLDSSIDHFLDANRGDKKVELCGKLAITQSILEAERDSKLYYDPQDRRGITFQNLENTWYRGFWRLLSRGVSSSEIANLFNNVTFISFNYDRCIEQFLLNAIPNRYYSVNLMKIIELVKKVKIFHPYGIVGTLPSLGQASPSVQFGEALDNGSELLALSQQIKTFTERIEDNEELNEMRNTLRNADTIVFLGFAFHDQNMALISPGGFSKVRRIFATAKGISERDREDIRKHLVKIFGFHLSHFKNSIELSDLECTKLFTEYERSLMHA